VERAGPIWGPPEEGHGAEKTLNTTVWSAMAQRLAPYGGQPGALIYVAAAALVPEAKLAGLGDTLCIPRVPAPSRAGGRVSAAAVARTPGEAVGGLAPTPPPKRRPGTL
jgi:hypothetical protein